MAPSTSLSAGCPKQRITQTPPDSHQKAASGTCTSTTGYCGGTCQRCISSVSTIVPRTAPDPQQFQLAAALHPASRNKRTNTRQIDRVFVDIIQNTLLQNTLPPFPLPRASLNWSTNHVFSFWRDQNLDVLPKLFPTSFLKTSRQAHNPAATCPQTSSDAEATILDPPFDWCLVLLRFPFLQGS